MLILWMESFALKSETTHTLSNRGGLRLSHTYPVIVLQSCYSSSLCIQNRFKDQTTCTSNYRWIMIMNELWGAAWLMRGAYVPIYECNRPPVAYAIKTTSFFCLGFSISWILFTWSEWQVREWRKPNMVPPTWLAKCLSVMNANKKTIVPLHAHTQTHTHTNTHTHTHTHTHSHSGSSRYETHINLGGWRVCTD